MIYIHTTVGKNNNLDNLSMIEVSVIASML